MLKVLVLSYWNVNCPAFGGGRRVEALLNALGDRAVICQPAPSHPSLESLIISPDFGKWRGGGINWGLCNYSWPSTMRRVRRFIAQRKPPVVVLTSIWTYFPLHGCPALPVVLDAHDVHAAVMEERFGVGHPFTRMITALERHVARRAAHVFACSELDRARFMARYGLAADKVSVAPNGVDFQRLAGGSEPVPARIEQELAGRTVLFFMGRLNYLPNEESMEFLSRSVLPDLERRLPGRFRLLVCGGGGEQWASAAGVVYAGEVSDGQLTACLRRADICLAPTFTGSGTRLKILEYWACRKPVIATAKGVEGLPCVSGKHLVIAEARDFVSAICELARQPDQANALAEAGHEAARQLEWQKATWPVWSQGIIQRMEEAASSISEAAR